jgi:uncharacterized protein YeaO (DUF488 family)
MCSASWPAAENWQWYEEHPDATTRSAPIIHDSLRTGPYNEALMQLAQISSRETFTLLHQCDDAIHNSAMALYEYLSELQAYCPPRSEGMRG